MHCCGALYRSVNAGRMATSLFCETPSSCSTLLTPNPTPKNCRPDPGRHWHRLWRHWHQPPVRAQGGVQSQPPAPDAREHLRHPVDDLLDADGDRVAEVRDADPASRQQRRRRPSVAMLTLASTAVKDRPAFAGQVAGPGDFWHRDLLWGRGDHAGHFGAISAVEGWRWRPPAWSYAWCPSHWWC